MGSVEQEGLRLVPYVRVSEDPKRKGQNPDRQVRVIEEWAQREGVELLDPVLDEGSSASKKDPFQRPRFVLACERAEKAGAQGVVVETGDRFTRLDSEVHGWAKVELGRRYGLELFFADLRLDEHGSFAGRIRTTLNVESGHRWVKEHARKVRSGMAAARDEGQHVGRPPKELSEGEMELVRELRPEVGWRRIAHRINKDRGVFELADPEARKKRSVSKDTVRRRFLELGPGGSGRDSGSVGVVDLIGPAGVVVGMAALGFVLLAWLEFNVVAQSRLNGVPAEVDWPGVSVLSVVFGFVMGGLVGIVVGVADWRARGR